MGRTSSPVHISPRLGWDDTNGAMRQHAAPVEAARICRLAANGRLSIALIGPRIEFTEGVMAEGFRALAEGAVMPLYTPLGGS